MASTVTQITWSQMAQDAKGTIYVDKFDGGLRFIIMRGPASLCAYIGVPIDHPLAGFEYDDLPIRAHGGLTLSSEGNGTVFPSGFWWYGWDYAHSGDYCFYDDKIGFPKLTAQKWSVLEVESDSWTTIEDFKRLAKLAEAITAKHTK